MKITKQEEYGLRILLQIARHPDLDGLTIPEISGAEGLSEYNVAKLCRILRVTGFIKSNRGKTGGYTLAKSADEIVLNKLLDILGGRLFDSKFCEYHTGIEKICTNTIDCSVRSLWYIIQQNIDQVLNNLTLQDLIGSENEVTTSCSQIVNV